MVLIRILFIWVTKVSIFLYLPYMKRRFLVLSLVLVALNSRAIASPAYDVFQEKVTGIVQDLFHLGIGAVCCVGVVLLVLGLKERREKGRVRSLPSTSAPKQPEPAPALVTVRASPPDLQPAQTPSQPDLLPVINLAEKEERGKDEFATDKAASFQKSLQADESLIRNYITDFFLCSFPSSELTGNFSWAAALPGKTEASPASLLICAGNSGEGGISGAMKSLLQISFLQHAVVDQHLFSPEQLLTDLQKKSSRLFRLPESQPVALSAFCCLFDLKGGWLRFSCAGLSLWLVRNGEVKEFLPTEGNEYTVQTLGLRKGDCIYVSSGPGKQEERNKEEEMAGKNQLIEFLLTNHSLPMERQKKDLERSMTRLMRSEESFLMGLRIV
jgi:hypothetical protein